MSKKELHTLYPAIKPYDTGFLPVDKIHTLYWEQSGNPTGVPVVFLHGGPGGGSSPVARQFFDPAHYRIIVFDQRGAGKSTPFAELKNNTTSLLVSDMEKLRRHLNIDTWHIFGGSWGSTLALAYAIKHPARCLSLILRGIFLMRRSEIDWFMTGMKSIFPEAWDSFAKPLNQQQRKNILPAYYKKLTHKNMEIQNDAALSWSNYETACCALYPDPKKLGTKKDAPKARAIARIEAHYFLHNKFRPDNYLLNNVDKIKHLPCTIVQGRYDIICPPHTAWELHQTLPKSKLVMVSDAGHSAMEPGIIDALVSATKAHRSIKP